MNSMKTLMCRALSFTISDTVTSLEYSFKSRSPSRMVAYLKDGEESAAQVTVFALVFGENGESTSLFSDQFEVSIVDSLQSLKHYEIPTKWK